MATKISYSADAATHGDKPVTFEGAEDLGAFELASRWADRLSWPMPLNRSAYDDLAELAYMSALGGGWSGGSRSNCTGRFWLHLRQSPRRSAAASMMRSGSGTCGRYNSENLSSAVGRASQSKSSRRWRVRSPSRV